MNKRGRLQSSFLNLLSGFVYRILIMLTAFVVRTVFIKCLASEYLGVNGLFSSILSMLSLAELGVGTAMVYSMYQPLANKDYQRLQQLMRLYRKVYTIVGTVILVIGLVLTPFLSYLVKDAPDIGWNQLTFYYILYLLNTVTSYWFFAYRNSILQADQRAYVVSNTNTIFNIIKSVLQIVLLVCFHSFTIYLLTQIFCTIGQNICLAIRVRKDYPIFGKKKIEKLPPEETKRIFKDVKALMFSKVSHVILNSTDNIIISAFVGLNWVGLLSNFNMIVEAITGILTQVTGALQASLGNFFAKEDREAGYQLFCRIEFLNFWLYGFCAIALAILLNPFITVWLGDSFTLSNSTVIALAINFFVAGFMNTLWTFRSTLGLFTQGQYRPLIVAVINVVLSILFSFPWGVTGVLIATSLSRACVNLWYDPWLIHRKGFHKPVAPFYKRYFLKILLLFAVAVGMMLLSQLIFNGVITVSRLILMVLLTALLPNIIFAIVFFRTKEFQYFKNLVNKMVISRIKK